MIRLNTVLLGLALAAGGTAFAQPAVEVGPGGNVKATDGRGNIVETRNGSVKAGDVKVEGGRVKAGNVVVGGKGSGKKRTRDFVCGGDEERTIKNARINSAGDAVTVRGDCSLTILNSQIRGVRAIVVKGNGDVTIRNSQIHGSKVAILATNNADVKAKTSQIHGRIVKRGNADFTKGKGTQIKE